MDLGGTVRTKAGRAKNRRTQFMIRAVNGKPVEGDGPVEVPVEPVTQ